ncbi:predicted protein [Uncinocarpus reesii 1704]|uniref:Rrn9 domain-containing protein n=1 Tax=Uncinocarpus reesii (strain UAMH 1704) TaxID=336963 RepID=C4JHQ8_UNCRE|nr:uncharacterized protein UREG_02744 [Uncinocarpus reesii 1704]EEP77895.1 predicted protein [Uncinocarpus reesii 1704]
MKTVATKPMSFLWSLISTRNLFEGSRNTWLSWTKRERQEVAALETIRARDLSLHLYNAFALKERRKQINQRRPNDVKEENHDDGIPSENLSSTFAPSRAWTAWPLPAEIVPRTTEKVEKDDDENWTLRGVFDARPSAELEECLMAQMMKAAKERFQSREWPRKSAHARSRSRNAGSDSEAMMSAKEENDADHQAHDGRTFRPVVQADDEASKRILRPEARHILSKFDQLLLNLYRARQAYLTAADMAQTEYETEDDENKRMSTPHRRGRKRTRTTSRPSSSHLNVVNSQGPVDASNLSSPSLGTNRAPKSADPRRDRLGLRDWSDVLGIASMAGWSDPAVMRAARRCADLFEQNMVFRRLDEGKVQLEQAEDGTAVWNYVESGEDEDGLTVEDDQPTSKYIDKPRDYELFCPVEECKRHKQGFSRKWNLDQHLKKKHPGLTERSREKVEI